MMEESRFKDIDLNPKRGDNELYCDYKCRQWWANRLIKHYLKGRTIWYGHQGTFVGAK